MADAILRVFRGDNSGGKAVDYRRPARSCMVILDALHSIQAHHRPISLSAGIAKPPMRLLLRRGEWAPRLTCKTRMDSLPLDEPSRSRLSKPSRHQGSRHRRFLELQVNKKIPAFQRARMSNGKWINAM